MPKKKPPEPPYRDDITKAMSFYHMQTKEFEDRLLDDMDFIDDCRFKFKPPMTVNDIATMHELHFDRPVWTD